MQSLGAILRRAHVSAIYLVHGTLAGTDALGVLGHIQRLFPEFVRSWGEQQKRMVDSLVGDVGNYTPEFATAFEAAIQVENAEEIPVRRFHWSSENNHLGRAWAALRLLDELFGLPVGEQRRVLVWGHSHAGNVFALASNLLGGSAESRQDFFAALNPDEEADAALYRRVSEQLVDSNRAVTNKLAASLDLVTFGTPIRYGWETRGCGRLLHFVNHRPRDIRHPWQAQFPQSVDDLRQALLGETGDYIQQTFIAGTDLPISLLNLPAWQANRDLGNLFEPQYRWRALINRLKTAPRVAADGVTLLVDYSAADEVRARQLAGHAVYTTLAWLPFHLREVASRWYA
jgi:hypothetical protein